MSLKLALLSVPSYSAVPDHGSAANVFCLCKVQFAGALANSGKSVDQV